MPLRPLRNFPPIALLATAVLLLAAAPAAADGPVNGDFATEGLASWTTESFYENTEWGAMTSAEAEARFKTPLGAAGANVAATRYGGPDTAILAQTFALPAAAQLELSLYLFYRSTAPIAVPSPDTLFVKDAEGEPGGNQQVRVDVLKSNAPLESLSPNDILATLYASPPGGPTTLAATKVSADLTPFAGQTVTLRIAGAVSDGPMSVGVGNVALNATPLPAPPPPAPAPAEVPSTPISDGVASPVADKLVHRLATGAGLLRVRLPAAGTLIVSDARRKAAVASAFATRRTSAPQPALIRTASVAVDRPQNVHVSLRPTAAAARLLNRTGHVRFRLQLTFDSAEGAVSTGTYRGVLVKRRPRPEPAFRSGRHAAA